MFYYNTIITILFNNTIYSLFFSILSSSLLFKVHLLLCFRVFSLRFMRNLLALFPVPSPPPKYSDFFGTREQLH